MPPDPNVHAGVAVYIEHPTRRSVLLVHRAGSGEYASDGHGEWAMPGGWVDLGESLQDTAHREVLEECGIDIAVLIDPIVTVSCMSGNGKFQIIVPIMKGIVTQEEAEKARVMEPDKHSEVRWVSISDLHTLPLFSSTRVYFDRMGLT